jgi:hypothetical protein
MRSVLRIMKANLHSLEFPANFTDLDFLRRTAVFNFRAFSHLRYISVPMHALQWHTVGRRVPRPADPRLIFPPTLELLRITGFRELTSPS